MPDSGPLFTAGLIFSAFAFAAAVGLVAAEKLRKWQPPGPAITASLVVYGSALLGTVLLGGQGWKLAVPLALGLATSVAAHRVLRDFTAAGRLLLTTNAQLMLFGLAWGAWFIATIPVSTLTRALLFAGYSLLFVTLPTSLVGSFEQWETLCRRTWRRPRTPLPAGPRDRHPKVSLHVPAYAEPPEIVIATLDALARLRYPNFEVLVIDNNTEDPGLWRPVETRCRWLGERFRFFHVAPLPGAKAGALNFALRQTAPDAELVGVVDSDYQAEPDFLERLVGYFDDPKIGFVQTPHDYREWRDSLYQRMCYWEYRRFFETTMVSFNEWDAAITVGTMCVIRRKALEEAGGWAEWCLTEDSELAVRIHALGYSGVYLTTTFGRGLIPETFEGYKRQRFRWIYGPVQQVKRHFRLFLPWPLGHPSALTTAQKVHELSHGLGPLSIARGFLLIPLGIALTVSMLVHREVVIVPLPLLETAFVFLTARVALRCLGYRIVLGCSLRDNLGAFIADSALSYTVAIATLSCLFNRPATWRRTNKFKALPRGLDALNSARTELLLGLVLLLFGAGAFAALPQPGLHLLMVIGILSQGFIYLAAPVLALLADRGIHGQQAGMEVYPIVETVQGPVVSEPGSVPI